jgi:hypothetical protein
MKPIVIITIAVVCSIIAVLGITVIIESIEKENPPVSLLFVQMATSGTFTETDDGHLLVLEGINEQTIYYSDRPHRIAGHMSTDELVKKWTSGEDSFESNPPNAVMTIV